MIAGEIINVDKPAGITSFRVVQRVRDWSQCRKVGHAGTLDPLATGVLLICPGKATKRVSELMEMEKEYVGSIELGKRTDTDDAEGCILSEQDVPDFTEKHMLDILCEYVGTIQQIPPVYSALKHNGSRAYELARKGQTVHLKQRTVRIYAIDLLDWTNPIMTIRVRCSRGTYIRALARDIGQRLGTGGYVKTLRRTRIGDYRVEDAYGMDELKTLLCNRHECISIH